MRLAIAAALAFATGCVTEYPDITITEIPEECPVCEQEKLRIKIDDRASWNVAQNDRIIINAPEPIYAMSIGNNSTVDSVEMYPDGNELIANRIIVGVKQPWRGVIASGRATILPRTEIHSPAGNESVSGASLNDVGSRLQLMTYYGVMPSWLPTRRDTLRREVQSGVAVPTPTSIITNVRGREWIGWGIRNLNDAGAGNRIITVTGYVCLPSGQFASETIFTVTTGAGISTTEIGRAVNEWDLVEVGIGTAGGNHTFYARIIAEDY